jgi:hypothetical protein
MPSRLQGIITKSIVIARYEAISMENGRRSYLSCRDCFAIARNDGSYTIIGF